MTESDKNAIEAKVKHILDEKAKDSNADTSKDEIAIDKLVYHLYQLTYDEVLIVDPGTSITREEYDAKDN